MPYSEDLVWVKDIANKYNIILIKYKHFILYIYINYINSIATVSVLERPDNSNTSDEKSSKYKKKRGGTYSQVDDDDLENE